MPNQERIHSHLSKGETATTVVLGFILVPEFMD